MPQRRQQSVKAERSGAHGLREFAPFCNDSVSARSEEGVTMSDMGTFRTTMAIENPLRRGTTATLADVLVDTGAELTWVPRAVLETLGVAVEKHLRFQTADGRVLDRDIGYAIVHAGGTETNDEVVFAEPTDLVLLGARSLEGLNLRVDPRSKQLVAAGPILAAVASS
jgi:clan AA aspartic protease